VNGSVPGVKNHYNKYYKFGANGVSPGLQADLLAAMPAGRPVSTKGQQGEIALRLSVWNSVTGSNYGRFGVLLVSNYIHWFYMPLVRLGPHVCNPLPSLTLDSGLIPHRPSRHAVIFNGKATNTATQLSMYVATPMPLPHRRKCLERMVISDGSQAIL